jgi:histidine ammonia-lyase
VPTLDSDRELHKDIAAVRALIDSGELVAAVRGACYENGP